MYVPMASFLRPVLGRTEKCVVLGFFDECIREGLLALWAQTVRASDRVTLVLIGREARSQMLAEAASLCDAYGLEADDAADVALLSHSAAQERRMAAEADFLLTRRIARAPFAALARVASPRDFFTARAARRQKAVFILGMHRSGTSAMARLVNILGVPLSRPDDLLPAAADNPTGFWESRVAVQTSEALLGVAGGGVFDPPELEPGWELAETLEAQRWHARKRCSETFGTPEWALKDPRCCFTLPFWRAALDIDPVAVITYRNPLEVAGSLEERDGMPVERGLALWERYVRSSLAVAEGLPVCIHAYEALLEDPEAAVDRLHAFLLANGFTLRDADAALTREAGEFLRRDLRHHRHAVEDLRRVATPDQVALYESLDACQAADPGLPERPPTPRAPAGAGGTV